MRKLVIFGDSTTQEYSENAYPQQGWAYFAKDYFDGSIEVINVGHGGFSLKAFCYCGDYRKGKIAENVPEQSEWQRIKEQLDTGDILVLYWAGINDMLQTGYDEYREQKNGDYVRDWQNRRKESYIHIGTGLGTHRFFTVTSCVEEYLKLFTEMVSEVKALGVTTILVRGTGKYYPICGNDKNVISVVREYTRLVEDVAKSTDSLYLDVGSEFEKEFAEIGYKQMMEKYYVPADNVHYNVVGAERIAELFLEKLKQSNSELKRYLK